MTDISQAIEMAVRGEYPPGGSKVDGHSFYIRSVKSKSKLKGDETSYFRHEHVGKDDRVFYSIKLGKKKGEYKAKIKRVQFRGPFVKNGFKDIGDSGIDVTDALNVLKGGLQGWTTFAEAISDLNVQGYLDGNWLPAAAKVVDMIGKRMARDI